MHWELIAAFFAISFVYASVGFGGGSSYLAILSLFIKNIPQIKLTALICNIVVVTGGTFHFVAKDQMPWKKLVLLVVASIPLTYLGAQFKLKDDTFFVLLGITLLFAAGALLIKEKQEVTAPKKFITSPLFSAGLGGVIGILSGMVSIGGGIFLSPILNILKWDAAKKIAATSSMFILVNSVAGIAGQAATMNDTACDWQLIFILALSVFAGGQLGSVMGLKWLSHTAVKRVTAIVISIAAFEVLHKHLHF